MELFNVYSLYPVEPVRGKGCFVYDAAGTEYLDLYGGHAVISIGHAQPDYVRALSEQAARLGFYSNSVENSLQTTLAEKLGRASGYDDYSLFLCNSGAEANENALKLASFHTGRTKVLAFSKAFHGRTSGAVAATDNPAISAPFNRTANVEFVPLNDLAAARAKLATGEFAAVIIEGIQGVAGIHCPADDFLRGLRTAASETGTQLILDEIQSGYGRTGRFFAHQAAGIRPDLITTAKGMGNGFPIGGVLIAPHFEARPGLLGTTFGGNHLACAAAIAVLDVMERDGLVENAATVGEYLLGELHKITTAKGMGNGFPIGGVLIAPHFEARPGLLGTTFGGNHLACAAAIAVLDVMERDGLVENAATVGEYLLGELHKIGGLKEVRGRGLMIGIELDGSGSEFRKRLLFEKHIFTGGAGASTVRLLPALCLTRELADRFLNAFKELVR